MRYILFSGYCYYPSGGCEDNFLGFDTLEGAHEAGNRIMNEHGGPDIYWYNILDTETLTPIKMLMK